MDANTAEGLKTFLIQDLKNEFAATKKVVAAVPEDRKSYTPDAKSKNAGDLAWHIVSVELWFLDSMIKGTFAMDSEPAPPTTIAETVDRYEKGFSALMPGVEALSGEKLAQVMDFFGMQYPAVTYLGFAAKHSIHHRGQLSAYLRPMGAKVPSIYGGSADEPFQM